MNDHYVLHRDHNQRQENNQLNVAFCVCVCAALEAKNQIIINQSICFLIEHMRHL